LLSGLLHLIRTGESLAQWVTAFDQDRREPCSMLSGLLQLIRTGESLAKWVTAVDQDR
jgi:hypothetical protein